ncbi:hypothetical protein EHI46_30435 [Rhizobium leguminosarum]|uniref:hypothetical protein n=1 Tax=Rhizobium leguminosarum TaxID=384 RepID=UPI000FF19910|nr:hypothetical protein [Rhizobium leguminosarum]RWY65647.1 hypothetical protein EHI46_30435 [Rhizobium leguminosarum]
MIAVKLATGQTSIDLDPALIEDSFMTDRLAQNGERFSRIDRGDLPPGSRFADPRPSATGE